MRYDLQRIMDEYPPLTPSEELKMIEENKDNRENLNKLLIFHNVALVLKIVNDDIIGYENYRDELFSVGFEVLNDIVRKFDPSKGVKFSSYACVCIKRRILYFVKRNIDRVVKHERYHLAQKIGKKTDDPNKGDSTVENLVYDLIDPCWSLYPSSGKVIENRDIESLCGEIVREIKNMKNISTRDKRVIFDYFYSSSGKKTTFATLGKKYGFTSQCAQQKIVRNLPKIRRMLKRKFGIFDIGQIYGEGSR